MLSDSHQQRLKLLIDVSNSTHVMSACLFVCLSVCLLSVCLLSVSMSHVCLYVSLSVSMSFVCLYVSCLYVSCLFLCLSLCLLSVSISVCLFSVSMSLVCMSLVCLYVSLSVSLSVSMSLVCMSLVCLYVFCLSLCLFVCLPSHYVCMYVYFKTKEAFMNELHI